MEQKFNKKVIVILGPTGIGKTELAIQLAKKFNLNIISADAFQIYKEINIGTNKPTNDEINNVNYYGINLIDLDTNYNIYEFQKYARNIINNSNQISIIVGGSMLYLDSVIYDYSLRSDFDNSNKYEDITTEELFNKLIKLDPEIEGSIQKNNRKRVITALNYFLQFNESIRINNNKKIKYFNTFTIYIKPGDKQELNKLNKKRINNMLSIGWIEEVKNILIKYPNFLTYNSSKAIGYTEIVNSIIHNTKLDEEKIAIKTNQFVKHQLSWYKKNELDFDLIVSKKYNIKEIENSILEFIK